MGLSKLGSNARTCALIEYALDTINRAVGCRVLASSISLLPSTESTDVDDVSSTVLIERAVRSTEGSRFHPYHDRPRRVTDPLNGKATNERRETPLHRIHLTAGEWRGQGDDCAR